MRVREAMGSMNPTLRDVMYRVMGVHSPMQHILGRCWCQDKSRKPATVEKPPEMAYRQISIRTGLREETVADLLQSGWEYTERLNEMPYWQKPGPLKFEVKT